MTASFLNSGGERITKVSGLDFRGFEKVNQIDLLEEGLWFAAAASLRKSPRGALSQETVVIEGHYANVCMPVKTPPDKYHPQRMVSAILPIFNIAIRRVPTKRMLPDYQDIKVTDKDLFYIDYHRKQAEAVPIGGAAVAAVTEGESPVMHPLDDDWMKSEAGEDDMMPPNFGIVRKNSLYYVSTTSE